MFDFLSDMSFIEIMLTIINIYLAFLYQKAQNIESSLSAIANMLYDANKQNN